MAHIMQTFTVLPILQPCPPKPGKHLGFSLELQELGAAVILPVVAAQGPPNPNVTLLAWEVLELQISGGWESTAGKHIIVCGHCIALVLIPSALLETGHQAMGIFSLIQSSHCQFSGHFHLCSSHGSEALQWRRGPQHQDVHCSAPHSASYNHTDPHIMRWGQN